MTAGSLLKEICSYRFNLSDMAMNALHMFVSDTLGNKIYKFLWVIP